ncbi:MAG: alpha/beta fold hydrolase [Candidatus Dormibacteria bacterium]
MTRTPNQAPGAAIIERDGVRLHYLEWGATRPDRPSMLLLHGLSSNARFWSRTAEHLDGWHIVALDQRSHGLSDRPQAGNHNPNFVADAHALVLHLGLQQPLVAGHSWGATIALEYAAAHAARTGAVCVMDGPVWVTNTRWEDVKDFVQPPFPVHSTHDDAYRAQERYIPGAWGDDLRPFVEAGLVEENGGYRSTLTVDARRDILQGMFGADTHSLWTAVSKLPASVLLARSGPQQFLEMKERGAVELAAHVPGVHVRWFDTPHDIPLYEPAAVAAELVSLAERIRA